MSKFLHLALVACLLLAGVPASAATNRFTDFFRAVAVDHDVDMRALLQQGMDPNLRDAVANEPALIIALRVNADRVFAVLLQSPEIDIEVQAVNGDTPLMLASYKGKTDAVRALLAKKAEPNRPGWTALHYAAAGGYAAIVALLLDRSAYIDAGSPNQTTPLMMAAKDGHAEVVKLLLEEGADASLRNEAGMTAADFARKYKQAPVLDLLAAPVRRGGR